MEQSSGKPKIMNRLTLFILLAMVLGIAIGFIINQTLVADENIRLEEIGKALLKNPVEETKAILLAEQKELRSSIEKILEPFSLLSDIFLRLIKMIVAPLVFTTLVVGVAKLGDLNAV